MAKRKKLDHTVLAEGEHTGHRHQAFGEDVALYEESGGLLTLEAPHGADVTHQEHAPIIVPPGTYTRSIVQEYSHFEEEARNVAD